MEVSVFNEKDLIEILSMTNYELLYYIDTLPHTGYKKIKNLPYYICFVPDDCLVAPLVCSHIDIASKWHPSEEDIQFDGQKLYLKQDSINFFKEKILGGDDRCGVMVMLEALKNNLPYILAFFNFEEPNNGFGAGSKKFGEEQKEILIKSSMFIGLDWLREKEFAVYSYGSAKCSKILREDLGLKELKSIALTDCAILATFSKKPAIALSVGYFNQHSSMEYIILSETQQAYKRLEDIFNKFYNDFWVVLSDVESLNSYLEKLKDVIDNKISWH
jgi:hypothetical protein